MVRRGAQRHKKKGTEFNAPTVSGLAPGAECAEQSKEHSRFLASLGMTMLGWGGQEEKEPV